MKNWTENLKVGDYVFMSWRSGTSLRKVEKITPKGNIKVDGILFNKDGSERGVSCAHMPLFSPRGACFVASTRCRCLSRLIFRPF